MQMMLLSQQPATMTKTSDTCGDVFPEACTFCSYRKVLLIQMDGALQ